MTIGRQGFGLTALAVSLVMWLVSGRLYGDKSGAREGITRLIDQLDDDSFKLREQASERLAELGEPALIPLRSAAERDPRPEVSWRARAAVTAIQGRVFREIHCLRGHKDTVQCLAISPCSRFVATAGGREVYFAEGHDPSAVCWLPGKDFAVRIWDLQSGKLVRTIPGHKRFVRGLQWSQDGRRLTSTGGGVICTWNAESGELLRSIRECPRRASSLQESSDGRIILGGFLDAELRLFDSQTGDCIRRFEGHTGPVHSVALTPKADTAISCGDDGFVRIWNVITGQESGRLFGHDADVTRVTISPNGRDVLSASADGTARLWDLESRRLLHTLAGHEGPVLSIAFSPDGRFVLTGGLDASLRIWDARSGKEVHRYTGHTGPVSAIGVSSDNASAVSTSWDGTVRVWKMLLADDAEVSPPAR